MHSILRPVLSGLMFAHMGCPFLLTPLVFLAWFKSGYDHCKALTLCLASISELIQMCVCVGVIILFL